MAVTVFPAAAAASRYERTVFIKSTQSWTVPSDVSSIEVYLFAGGGGGGGGAGGYSQALCTGGSGGATYDVISVTPGSAHTITIGAGGSGAYQGGASNGATSSFGSLLSQTGGFGGSWSLGTSVTGVAGNRLGGTSGSRYSASNVPSAAGLLGLAGGGSTNHLPYTGGGGAAGAAGAANTGGGGGGGGGDQAGGNGGSGLAILKYWSAV